MSFHLAASPFGVEQIPGVSVRLTPQNLQKSENEYWTKGYCPIHKGTCIELAPVSFPYYTSKGELLRTTPKIYPLPKSILAGEPLPMPANSSLSHIPFPEDGPGLLMSFVDCQWPKPKKPINFGEFVEVCFDDTSIEGLSRALAFTGTPSEHASLKDVLMRAWDDQKDGPACLPLEQLMPPFVAWHANTFAAENFPNCFNGAKLTWESALGIPNPLSKPPSPYFGARILSATPFSDRLKDTPDTDLLKFLLANHFKPIDIKTTPLKTGDVLVFKEFRYGAIEEGSDDLRHAAVVALPHATDLAQTLVFTKNGLSKGSAYVFQSLTHTIELYSKPDMANIVGYRYNHGIK